MKQTPILDTRDQNEILEEVKEHARSYTPEWRCDGAPDDPGTALTELFGEMFYQTVDRMNSVMGKLHTEFLNLIGFQMPDPVPASGILRFDAADAVTEPVPVPAGTQVFVQDEAEENIVYETERRVESTAAGLTDLFFVDARGGVIQRLDTARPQPFFTTVEGENLQRHSFSLWQNDVLALTGPFEVEVELNRQTAFTAVETAALLAKEGQWSFTTGKESVPFTAVRAEGHMLHLTYDGEQPLLPDEEGRYAVNCSVGQGNGTIFLDSVHLRSRPVAEMSVDGVYGGDVRLDLSGGDYCFGRRPAPYAVCYFRSDQVFRKRGAVAKLRLEIAPMIFNLVNESPQYLFNQRIIDKRDAVAVVPDDVYIQQVVWEYFNGTGWKNLSVSGNQNPFSCKDETPLHVVFRVPDDMAAAEVNAETGYFIRARVVHVENQMSSKPRWVVPFLKDALCTWSYEAGQPVEGCRSENNGEHVILTQTSAVEHLRFPAVSHLPEEPPAMYFCFDRSPHAMPLSLLFEIAGHAKMEDKIRFEAWNGRRFEPIRSVDLTQGLLHSGMMLLYLPEKLPERTCFGVSGCWLRLSRSAYHRKKDGVYPQINGLRFNTVTAVQRERVPDVYGSTGAYEANKELRLTRQPVLSAQVWVDEVSGLAVADAEALVLAMPERVRIEREDRVLAHCWVKWERTASLSLAGPADRCYTLDAVSGTAVFGDGQHGMVPPAGESNIRVSYYQGGGSRGNCPAGAVTDLIGALPRISGVVNVTPMSGGTDRFTPEKVDAIGNKYLRHRGRAAGIRDFEEIVTQEFPQARHVKCFSNRDAEGNYAPGHISMVVEGCSLDDQRVVENLCQRIDEYLTRTCDCVLTAEGRLHVIGSTVITVSSRISVELADLDQSAVTQQAIVRRLEHLVDHVWREREIGTQLCIHQIWQTVRDTPNVRLIHSILLEGCYDDGGVRRMIPLESDDAFPYATVKSGTHLIQID